MHKIRTEGDLDDTMVFARLAAVVNGWAARGLFDELADDAPKSPDDLPGDDRALRITARILAHAGLLARRADAWTLSPTGARLHDQGVLGSYRQLENFRQLGRLDEILEQGGPIVDDDGEDEATEIGAQPDDADQTREFQQMLYRRSAASARATAAWIDRDLDGPGRILDLGGGHGRYAIELTERGHDATIFDLPVSVGAARSMHGERLEYIEGDFFEDDLGGPYDAVLASNIVHGLSAEDNRRLIDRLSDVLAPGGALVVKDMFLDEFDAWPPAAVYFGLKMLLYTREGDTYSLDEIREWFDAAGLQAREPVVFESFSLAVGVLEG